ncbi:MAG: DUF3108 domain-containing protein [Halieaceae bacterium]|jgi:hypothetical protein|nr:DUF3108 domain-containing protein [Halieaceae bacterium]
MISLFHPAESNIPAINNLVKLVLAFSLFAAGLVSADHGHVDTDTGADIDKLRPYNAEYRTTARGLRLTLQRELKINADGIHTLTNGGKLLVAGFLEKSVFEVAGTQIIPGSYVYQGSGLLNRRREVHFTPGTDTLRSLYKDVWYDLPYTEGTLDRMSQQEQLRLLLLNDPTPKDDIVITVADGKRVKSYQLVFIGEELLDTPLGPVQTLHFERVHKDSERSSNTWLAPAWDYMMVKTVHVEDGKPVEATLTKANIDGIALGH